MTKDDIRIEMLQSIVKDGKPVTVVPEVLDAMAALCHVYYERGIEDAVQIMSKKKKKK